MNKNLIITLLLALTQIQAQITEINFSKGKLPAKIIIFDDYYSSSGNIFLINRSYTPFYSQLVEYNVEKRQNVKEIFTSESNDETLSEYHYDGRYIVFVILKRKKIYLSDIYVYDTKKEILKTIREEVPSGKTNKGHYPTGVRISQGKLVWLEHDFGKGMTNLHLYDIQNAKEEIIVTEPFLKKSILKTPIVFVEIYGDRIFYDKQNDKGNLKIVDFKLGTDSKPKYLNAKPDILYHCRGAYNEENGFLALYAKAKDMTNEIYIYNLNKKKGESIVGFEKFAFIYDDFLSTSGTDVLYTIKLEVSERVSDQFYAEIYDLTIMDKMSYAHAVDIIKTKRYFALLKYDEKEGQNLVHLLIKDFGKTKKK